MSRKICLDEVYAHLARAEFYLRCGQAKEEALARDRRQPRRPRPRKVAHSKTGRAKR